MIILSAYNFLPAGTHSKTYLEFRESVQDSIRKEAPEKKEKKSPNGAMLRSLAIPGWGQFYNDQIIKGLIVTTGQATLIGFAIYFNGKLKSAESAAANASDANLKSIYINEKNFYLDRRNLTFWLMGATVLLSMIDAYIDAHLYDFDTGPDLSLRIGPHSANKDLVHSSVLYGLSLHANF